MKKTNDFTEGSQIIQSVMTVITKIAMGITVLVGQKIGEKRPHEWPPPRCRRRSSSC